ncbi:unnamed protein product, partial [Heterosigma akashiwo]
GGRVCAAADAAGHPPAGRADGQAPPRAGAAGGKARKEISHKMLLNKHRVMEAMEQMKVTNKFVAIDLDHDGKGKKKKKRDGDDDDMDATVGGGQPF